MAAHVLAISPLAVGLAVGQLEKEQTRTGLFPSEDQQVRNMEMGTRPRFCCREFVQWELGGSAACSACISILAVDAYSWDHGGGNYRFTERNTWEYHTEYYLVKKETVVAAVWFPLMVLGL